MTLRETARDSVAREVRSLRMERRAEDGGQRAAPAHRDASKIGKKDHAAALRATPEITDDASLAAGAAAVAAARAAARDAAWDTARAAAGDAADRTLRPVVLQLQQSAFGLLDRMIDLPRRAA